MTTLKPTLIDKYRPQVHFTPEANWMNDPNGMVYFAGEYHLFYQCYPHGETWGPMHWGHAVSKDMVHWEHHPIALAPDEHGYIFSGSAVVDWRDTTGFFGGKPGLVAIFTHHDKVPGTDQPRQRQSLAYSIDNGRSWIKYEGNPVLTEAIIDFRDPKVFWHQETLSWIMILAAGDHVRLYRSSDLKSWVFASEFGVDSGSHAGVWECPDLFELPVEGLGEKKWVMLVSIGDDPECPEGSRTQYFIGTFDGIRFVNDHTPETILWFDYGRDNYAGVTWSDIPAEDGRRLFIGWMSNWKYAVRTPTVGWRSAMTLPRELVLYHNSEGVRLKQRPVRELKGLRQEKRYWNDVIMTPVHPFIMELAAAQMELCVEIESCGAERIDFHFIGEDGEQTTVELQIGEQQLVIDRTTSGKVDFHSEFGCRHAAPFKWGEEPILLRFYMDRSSIEVFAGDGELVMTDLIFPNTPIKGLEIVPTGDQAKLVMLEAYSLKSIYADGSYLYSNGTEG